MDYLLLARSIAKKVKFTIMENLSKYGFRGVQNEQNEDLKSVHEVDKLAADAITSITTNLPCQLLLESFTFPKPKKIEFTLLIDPIDGSVNWDRGIGDPGICIAVTKQTENIRFKDLIFSYVEGFRSGDYYYTQNNCSYFCSNLFPKTIQLQRSEPKKLEDAMGYLKIGYGGFEKQLQNTYPLFQKAKDIRAFDNTTIEIGEIARNAADFMVDARGLSDMSNLLAYPILKHAGGVITDFLGNPIDQVAIEMDQNMDYIAANSPALHQEIMHKLYFDRK